MTKVTKIQELIRVAKEFDAYVMPPASSSDIADCQAKMAELGHPAIPREYEIFLSQNNGFWWNGIEFFGTDDCSDTAKNVSLQAIVSANEEMEEWDDEPGQHIVVGRGDDEFYLYNTHDDCYELMEGGSTDITDRYPTFEALFYNIIKKYWEDIDDMCNYLHSNANNKPSDNDNEAMDIDDKPYDNDNEAMDIDDKPNDDMIEAMDIDDKPYDDMIEAMDIDDEPSDEPSDENNYENEPDNSNIPATTFRNINDRFKKRRKQFNQNDNLINFEYDN